MEHIEKIYVKIEEGEHPNDSYRIAEEALEDIAEVEEVIKIGVYQLVEVLTVRGSIKAEILGG